MRVINGLNSLLKKISFFSNGKQHNFDVFCVDGEFYLIGNQIQKWAKLGVCPSVYYVQAALENGDFEFVQVITSNNPSANPYAIKVEDITKLLNSYLVYRCGRDTPQIIYIKHKQRIQECLEEFNKYILPELYPAENKKPTITEMTPEQKFALGRRGELIVKRRLEKSSCYVERADQQKLEKGLVDFWCQLMGSCWFAEIKVRTGPFVKDGLKSFCVAKSKIEKYVAYAQYNNLPLSLYIVDTEGKRILVADIDDLLAETTTKTTKGDITFPYESNMPNATNNPQLNFWEGQFKYDTLTDEECDYILNCDEDPLEEVNTPTVTEKGEEPATNKTEHSKINDVVTFPNTNTNKEDINNMPGFTCADVDKKLAQITEMKKSLSVIKKYLNIIDLKEVEEILTKRTRIGVMPVLFELKPFVSNLEPFLDTEEQNAHIALVESIMTKRGYKVIYEKIDK